MVLPVTKYEEIDKTYTNLWKLSKEELKERILSSSRLALSFDQYVDKGSLVASILARHYSQVQLKEYDLEKEVKRIAGRKEKRKARRALRKGKMAPGFLESLRF